MEVERKITVKIPPGIDDGYQLRLNGEGETPPHGGAPGDLYVIIHVAPHQYFKRRDDNLLYDLKIPYPQAALGAEVEVPTLDGETTLNIHAGTQPGEIFKLESRGMPRLRGRGRGDLRVLEGPGDLPFLPRAPQLPLRPPEGRDRRRAPGARDRFRRLPG